MQYRDKLASLDLGGPGSGNYGHAGRPGEVGGSSQGSSGVPGRDQRAESIPAGKQGECFRNAASWVRDHDSHTLVHGKVTNGHGRRLDHAWAETSTTVADPTTGVQMPKDDWYDLVKAIPEARYSPTQAMVNMVRTGNLGPWTAEEVGTRHLDLGGAGSGNFGHAGRPGEVGGSAAGEGIATTVHAPGTSVQLPGRYDKTKVPKGALVVTSPHGYLTATKSSSDPDYFWVNHIRVADAAQGKGEGTALYKAALKAAQAHGSKGILKGDIPGRDVSTDAKRMWDRFDREGLTESVTTTVGGQSHTTRVLVRATAAKHLGGAGSGDVEGHPFRGNQWSEGGGSTHTHASATAALKTAAGHGTVTVADHPTAIRAAHETATVVQELRSKGYEMPESITVEVQGDHPSGEAGYGTTYIRIRVPEHLPPDVSLDEAYRLTFGGTIAVVEQDGVSRAGWWQQGEPVGEVRKFAGASFRDLVVHEMGHINRQPAIRPATRWRMQGAEGAAAQKAYESELDAEKQFERVARRHVSDYAATNPDEYVAEAFTILYNGGTLPPEAMTVYRALRGAEIR